MSRVLWRLLVKEHVQSMESWCAGLGWGTEGRGHGLSQGYEESESQRRCFNDVLPTFKFSLGQT